MLILDRKQVRACHVRSNKHPVGYAGVSYRDLLFVKGRSFASAKRQEAVRLCQEMLDNGRFCILLKERERGYTLCYQVRSSPAASAGQSGAGVGTATAGLPERTIAQPASTVKRPRLQCNDNRTILQRPLVPQAVR